MCALSCSVLVHNTNRGWLSSHASGDRQAHFFGKHGRPLALYGSGFMIGDRVGGKEPTGVMTSMTIESIEYELALSSTCEAYH